MQKATAKGSIRLGPHSRPIFAGPKGNTISKIEKYCLKICGHARKIKRESGVSRSDLNDERGNGSYGQFHGPDPERFLHGF